RVRVGARVLVSVPALPGQKFQGQVTRTAGVLDPGARTLRGEVDLPNPEGRLLPGMSATVAILPGKDRARLRGRAKARSRTSLGNRCNGRGACPGSWGSH